MLELKIDKEFKDICRKIIALGWSAEEWSLKEADDYFQTSHYAGGFDATEGAFCFGYYDALGEEYWFQITLEEIRKVTEDTITNIKIRPAQAS